MVSRVARRESSRPDRQLQRERPRAVELELMSHRFSSIAREMGEMLQRTAISTNIKEREDFSCTLLDAGGRLVVNAPHIPVHLGAMGLCVRELVAHRAMAPGDVVVTNHPAYGGSHLPDVTLVAPVHLSDQLLGYVACRAHHAEIGGIRPGSVPPDARSLAEEGVVIPPTLLVEGGEPRWERLEELLTGGPWPTRTPADNLADLRAMLAAILRGREALAGLAGSLGYDHVVEHMDALREMAAREVAIALGRLPDGVHRGRQVLDDGSPLVAAFTIEGRASGARLRGQRRGPFRQPQRHARHRPQRRHVRDAPAGEYRPAAQRGAARAPRDQDPRRPPQPAVRRRSESLSGGGRRQRGNLAAAGGHLDRGAAPGGLQPGHHEQHLVRGLDLRLLRDRRRRQRSGARDRTGRAGSTPT